MNERPKPPFPPQQQPMPGQTNRKPIECHRLQIMANNRTAAPDRLVGKKAIIAGADSGIGRAVAIAFAREGADVLIAYLNEHDDAQETKRWVEEAGRRAALVSGDIRSAAHCRSNARGFLFWKR